MSNRISRGSLKKWESDWLSCSLMSVFGGLKSVKRLVRSFKDDIDEDGVEYGVRF